MRNSKNRLVVLATLVLAFVCSICLSVFSFAFATTEAKTIDQVSIYMQRGATIRVATNAEQMGLRFTAVMDAGEYEGLLLNKGEDKAYASVKFGMVIVPADYVELEPLTEASLFGVDGEKKYQWTDPSNSITGQEYIINLVLNSEEDELQALPGFGDYVGFSGSITNIKDGVTSEVNNIDRDFVALSYIQVEDLEGKVDYKLTSAIASYDEDNSELILEEGTSVTRNAAQIAFAMVNDPNRADEKYAAENAAMQVNYIDKCVYDIIVKDGEEVISTEQVKYGSSYTVNVPKKEANYRFREVLTGLKDQNGQDAPATIEKVTGPATYTATYEKEFVIIDATNGVNNWANTSATNKANIVVTKAAKARFGTEDAAMAIKKTADGTSTLYNYFDFATIRQFDEVVFNVKLGPLADANAWVSTTNNFALGIGKEANLVTITDEQNWNEIKIVNTSSTTVDIYLNGEKVVTGGGWEAAGFSKMLVKFEWTAGTNYGIIFSDFVAKNYEKEGKSLVVFNNGGANASGETDVIEYVDNGKTYTLDSLMNTEKNTLVFKTSYGSNPVKANGYWAGGATGGIYGYKYNNAEITANDTITANGDTVFEAILGTDNSDVIFDAGKAVINDNGTPEDTSDDKKVDVDGTWAFNNDNTKFTVSKVASSGRNTNAIKLTFNGTDSSASYPNMYWNTNVDNAETRWFNNDVIYMSFSFAKQNIKSFKFGSTDLGVTLTWQTGVVVKFVKSDVKAGSMQLSNGSWFVPNKYDIYYMTPTGTADWVKATTEPSAALSVYKLSGAFLQLQTSGSSKTPTVTFGNFYGYTNPVTTPVEA